MKASLSCAALLVAAAVLIMPSVCGAEEFTIVALPDTQNYSVSYPAIFSAQTQWIVENREALNIVCAAHLGDVVQEASDTTQWDNANAAMSLLENPATTGLADGIPYGITPGNHDMPTTNYNAYFGVSRFDSRGYYGGHYGSNNDNSYMLLNAGGMEFVVIFLQYGPTADILNWANGIMAADRSKRAIIVSHNILDADANFTGYGSNIYNAVKGNSNLFLMLCGHNRAEARRYDIYNDNRIDTLMADYQTEPNGGNGFLRILNFNPTADTIEVKTWSPTLQQWRTGDQSEFTLAYDMEASNPIAAITTDVDLGLAPLTVNLDASSSVDGNSPIISYDWDFGDGNSDTGILTSHTYTVDGDYTVVLTVTGQNLLSDTAEKNIHVGPLDVNEVGDLSGNGRVDAVDYAMLADYWLTGELTVDIISNGIINNEDLAVIVDNWMLGVPIPNQGPVAYYMFDGNANDSSGFGRDGAILGDPTWAAGFDATVNGAIDLDGAGDLVNCGTFNPSGDGGNLTIAAWVKWDGLVTGADQMLIAKRNAWLTDMMWQIVIKSTDGAIQIASGNSDGQSIGAFNVALTADAWTHFAVTYDGTNAMLYLNGVNPVTVPFVMGFGTGSTVSIGAAYQGGSPTTAVFAGILDEVRLYDRALDVTEILELAKTE